ncbi:hypothetical protein RSOLAG22IIIB_08711 [Rhizoctonia solani]|uniref:30S ribosomal protein S17 n=1 Tax=Rhizoctonia solani TaxID=456999 RepID=A0A0K6FUR1_9AGAM|nr:hypothetical protein RSOLAG22IIIB_08711 [Rhizoctonia solani]
MPPLILKGIVTKAGFMQKTATVTVTRMVEHPHAHKVIASSKKYLVHDPRNELKTGDECNIQNCPPVSARKRFKLLSIVKKARSSGPVAVGQPASPA